MVEFYTMVELCNGRNNQWSNYAMVELLVWPKERGGERQREKETESKRKRKRERKKERDRSITIQINLA